MKRTGAATWLLVVAAVAVGGPVPAEDPARAEREYRVARRLAAEGSSQAGDALRSVIEAAPNGPLADDARVDLAVWMGAPGARRDLGALDGDAVAPIAELLERAASDGGDRAPEARFRRALMRLEPLPGRDVAQARLELLAVAADRSAGAWGVRAREVAAWIDATEGRFARAEATWQRIVVDHPATPEATAAREGLARLGMRAGRFDEAAARLAGAPSTDPALMELAVRGVLRWAGGGGAWDPARSRPHVASAGRGAVAIAVARDGRVLVADRRERKVVLYAAAGATMRAWTLDDEPADVAFDPLGRAFALAGDRVVRLDEDGPSTAALLGRFGDGAALAVDAAGRIYVVERRGNAVGIVGPGAPAPRVLPAPDGARFTDATWAGDRIVVADEKAGRLWTVRPDAAAWVPIAVDDVVRPGPIASDDAGQIAILDTRRDAVVLVGPDGRRRDGVDLERLGVRKAVSLAIGPDGSLDVLDAASERIVRVP